MKKDDIIIYACVIIGAGVGLLFNNAFPGMLIGLGIGYILKTMFFKQTNEWESRVLACIISMNLKNWAVFQLELLDIMTKLGF